MNNKEAITTCVKAVCNLATYAIGAWAILTFWCGNPFRKKVIVIQQNVPQEESKESEA